MDSNELDAFRARVLASPGAWTLLERDAYLPFDEDAHGAGQARDHRAGAVACSADQSDGP